MPWGPPERPSLNDDRIYGIGMHQIHPLNSHTASSQDAAEISLRGWRPRLVTLFLGAMIVLHSLLFFRLWPQLSQGHSDFVAFYSAGQIVRQGMGRQLYKRNVQTRLQSKLAPTLVSSLDGPMPYIHPPFEAAVFAPFAVLPYPVAYAVWAVVSILALLAAIVMLHPSLPQLRRWSGALPFLCAFAFFPAFWCLLHGQDSTFLLLFFVGAYVAMKRRQDLVAGICFGLALIKFQYVLPIMAILLLRRKWNILIGIGVTGAALTAASAAIVGWRETLHYPHMLLHQSAIDLTMSPRNMPNLRGFLDGLLGSGLVANWMVALVSIGLIVLVARRCKLNPGQPSFSLEFSLALAVSVLVGYHVQAQDLTLLLLPLLLVSEPLLEQSIARPASGILLAAVILLLSLSPLFFWLAALDKLPMALFSLLILLTVGVALALYQPPPARESQSKAYP